MIGREGTVAAVRSRLSSAGGEVVAVRGRRRPNGLSTGRGTCHQTLAFPPTTCGSSSSARRLWKIQRSLVHNKTTTTRMSQESKSSSVVGYQSIGSFHSENLADLMMQSKESYVPPDLPFDDINDDNDPSEQELEDRSGCGGDFLLDPSWTFLNHGAFGAALRVGHARANQWRNFLELQPLRYFDRFLLPHMAYSARLLADFVHAPLTDVALLPNVTSGLNSLLSGYARYYQNTPSPLNVIFWDTSYGSVKTMVHSYFPHSNLYEIPLQLQHWDRFMTSSNPEIDLEELLLDAVEKCRGTRTLLLLDHTSSNTALTFPIAQLAQVAKQHHRNDGLLDSNNNKNNNNGDGLLDVIVDGAHGLLAQDVNIQNTLIPHVDAYVTNGHKWFGASRGIAMLYAQNNWHNTILQQPSIVSHGSTAPDLFSRYIWDGCRDYNAALSIPTIHQYWTTTKPHNPTTQVIRHQLRHQLQQGIAVLAQHWHSTGSCEDASDPSTWPGRVTVAPFSSLLSPMALVALPKRRQSLLSSSSSTAQHTSADAKKLQDALYDQHIEVPIKCINGKLYVRLSCHIYNTLDDFDKLGRAVTTLLCRTG